jgi:hypothetical protein
MLCQESTPQADYRNDGESLTEELRNLAFMALMSFQRSVP